MTARPPPPPPRSAPPRIIITNIQDHEVVPHPLVVLDGHIDSFASLALSSDEWFLDARLEDHAGRGCFWPVTSSGRFKALVLLPSPGKYAIMLCLGSHVSHVVIIEYQPPISQYIVRFYYQKCFDASASDGFDAPPGTDNSDFAAMQKIRFNALLLQTATAEMFVNAGLPRKSFALEFADDGLPVVHLLQTTFSTEEARRIHDQKLIKLVEDDLVAFGYDTSSDGLIQYKHAVILGCSTYDPVAKTPVGHTALGGGKVGSFGSCGLHMWPRHLGEVTSCCLNNTRVDTNLLWDDSAYRGTLWANFSTGIGAFIHELGHTFGLGHSTSGIMARGFDDMNKLFCVYQADHKRQDQLAFYQDFQDGRLALNHSILDEVTGPSGAHWNKSSALQLVHCPWISKNPKQSTGGGPSICWRKEIRGPVGHGSYNGHQNPFNQTHLEGELGAIRIKASQYLDKITCYTRDEFAQLDPQKVRSRNNTHWVVLDADEFVTHVEVRAMAWIDGLRLHTNLRATRWFGGFGGELHVLCPDPGSKVNGFFGSRGDQYVGRLGVYCTSITEPRDGASIEADEQFRDAQNVQPIGPVGPCGAQGPYQDFDHQDAQIGAIIVKCKESIESIRVVTPDSHALSTQDSHHEVYTVDELVFALRRGEWLVRVTVRSKIGHGLQAVRFHTNQRSSAWFGGKGGDQTDELISPSSSHRICGLFGRQRKQGVESLGVYVCENTPVAYASFSAKTRPLVQVTAVGLAEGDGPQRSFSSSSTSNTENEPLLGAVLVEAQSFVTNVQTFTRRELSAMSSSSEYQQFLFVLGENEFITHVEVRAMCWVDGMRIHTNLRSSPWYGGSGGDLHFLHAPPGFQIQGFFGSKGHCYVGKLGALCSPIGEPGQGAEAASLPVMGGTAASQWYSLLGNPSVDKSFVPAPPTKNPPQGVLVAVDQNVLMYVSTYDSLDEYQRCVDGLQAFTAIGAQLHSFSLQAGEFFIQIDASTSGHHGGVEGICFHTSSRCSSWFGGYTDSQLCFTMAPPNQVIKTICGVPGAMYLHDIVGDFTPRDAMGPPRDPTTQFTANCPVLEDPGTYDVRIQSQSAFGIASVHLLKKIEHEDLDQHSWSWPIRLSANHPPQLWCLPQRLLEHHIPTTVAAAKQATTTAKQLLFTQYAIGAMDAGGAYSTAGCPPSP